MVKKLAPIAKSPLKVKKPPQMSPDAKRTAREMHVDRKVMPSAIAKTLGRDLSCICR